MTEEMHRSRVVTAYTSATRRTGAHEITVCHVCQELWPCQITSLRAQVAELTAALLGVGTLLLHDRRCWCPDTFDMWQGHTPQCLQARAALAALAREGAG